MNFENQSLEYRYLFSHEQTIPNNRILPHRIYRISKYSRDGKVEDLIGNDETIIFSLGVHEGNLYAIKLSSVKPKTFLSWVKPFVDKTFEIPESTGGVLSIHFDEIAPPLDVNGKLMYEGHIKQNAKLKELENPYRRYTLKNIVGLREIFFNSDAIRKLLK